MGAHVCSARVCTSRIVHGYGLRLTSASGSSGRILRRVVLCILGSLSLRGAALCGSWFVACGAVHRTPFTVHKDLRSYRETVFFLRYRSQDTVARRA